MFARLIKLTAIAALLSTTSLSARAEMTPDQKKEIEAVIKDYLLSNPEILRDMANLLEQKSKNEEEATRAEGLKANAKLIYRYAGDPAVGDPKADVTVVEFIDYNCGWCKKSVAEVAELLKRDKKVRFVFKEFPIFGEGSEYAAKAALAVAQQGKYWEMHSMLFASEAQITAEVVDAIAKKIGVDVARMKKDMQSKDIENALATNQDLAKALAINGTPGFVVGEEVVPGYIPLDALAEKVAGVRVNGCKIC
jgi:protein-disulfide isomerase